MTKLLIAVTVVTLVAGMAAANTVKRELFSAVGIEAAPPTITISVEELLRQVDVSTLPVTEIKDLY